MTPDLLPERLAAKIRVDISVLLPQTVGTP